MKEKKNKNRTYLYFTILACLIAIITTGLIGYMAVLQTKNDKSYPSYEYDELVDRSEDRTFEDTLPGQLYEAESLELSGECTIDENYSASGKEVVGAFTKGCIIRLDITCDTSTKAMLSIATNFVSPSSKSISANTLVKVYVNSTSEQLKGTIRSNFNRYDFSLDDLTVVHLLPGENKIEIVSEGDYFDVDYLTLKGKERHVSESSIKSPNSTFLEEESRQYFQPDQAILKGPLIIKDEKETTDGYSAYFSNPNDTMEYDIHCQEETTTTASFLGRLQKNNVQPSLKITINGETVNFESTMNGEYREYSLGTFQLKKGLNQIIFGSDSGSFYFSCLILNSDITHSPTKANERYEAENALRKKGPTIVRSLNASGGYVVSQNEPESYLDFTITSKKEDDIFLSITLSYVLLDQKSSFVFETSLNGTVLDTSSCLIKNTTGYDHYQDFLLGEIHLKQGENLLRIYSFSGGYNIDCITLIRKEERKDYSAESLINEGMLKKHVLTSDDGYVLEAKSSTWFLLDCYWEKEEEVTLCIRYSLPLYDELDLSSWMEVYANKEKIQLPETKLPSTTKASLFRKAVLGKITLQKGLNEIRVNTITTGINFDTITLER